ncbi:MAG: amidophosphoribosyltransferase [Pseudomonadota bacterium]
MSTPASDYDPDEERPREECGVFGMLGATDAANFVALGLHALQHRGQEAGGIVSYDDQDGFQSARKFGYVRDNFTRASVMKHLPGPLAIGHVRYSTSGSKGATAIRDVQPFFGEFAMGGAAIAHNGNLTNARALRRELVERGAIFQSSSDTECIIHLMARSFGKTIPDRMKDALRQVEGAFSIVAMTRSKLIGVRDPLGIRPLVLGRLGDAYVLSSETCGLDIIGAKLEREIEPGEMVVITDGRVDTYRPFESLRPRPCIFEYVYFSRPDSIIGGRSVYEVRREIGRQLAREAPAEADMVCPVPDSGTPAAIGFAQESGIPFEMGIVRNQYVGRTFIEPTEQIRDMGVRLKLNVNRSLMKGKRVVLVDDSVVRGTTSRKIKDMVLEAGAAEVHFRIASPPAMWPDFYGVDMPTRGELLAAQMSEEEMRKFVGVESLRFISIDGLYRAVGEDMGRNDEAPRYHDAVFTGDYPTRLTDCEMAEAEAAQLSLAIETESEV